MVEGTPSRDPRRRFGAKEQFAAFEMADGHCESCGVELPENWHADHVVPWSEGGPTDAANVQALCPACNLSKGSQLPRADGYCCPEGSLGPPRLPFRKWQHRARQHLHERRAAGAQDYLLEATPGSGKTRVAVQYTDDLLVEDVVERVVVVAPSERLKGQWANAYAQIGIDLTAEYKNRHAARGISGPGGTQGVVVTYAQLGRLPDPHRLLAVRQRTLVIFDEIHHAGETKSWGEALRTAFEPAVFRLAMSGTPFRRDNCPIPFVTYKDGRSQEDFRYSYGEALRDDVCRSIIFPGFEGRMEWLDETGTVEKTFDDDLDERGASRRLRTALSPTGDFLRQMLADADRRLQHIRATGHPDAGGLVFAIDCAHAHEVAGLLEEITGETPVVAVYDREDACEEIEAFATSSRPWLVAVRMVSEGVDIPRLRIGVYATNVVAELYFRQAVGRFVRVIPELEEQTAYLVLPRDRRFVELAESIQEERDHVLTSGLEPVERGASGDHASSLFLPIASTGLESGEIYLGEHINPDELAIARQVKSTMGDPEIDRLPDAKIVMMLRANARLGGPLSDGNAPQAASAPLVLWDDQNRRLRKQNNRLVALLHHKTGVPFDHIHGRWIKERNGNPQEAAGNDELTRKREWLSAWLRDESRT